MPVIVQRSPFPEPNMAPYEETIDGLPLLRMPGADGHETVCRRLHERVGACLSEASAARLLEPRSAVELAVDTVLRPDLALIMRANGRLWLAAEVIQPGDHQADTVTKKAIYEDRRVPRLWMVDPRYDNVEIYHATPYGLMLKCILAGSEVLIEPVLPTFTYTIRELFQP